VTGETHRTLQFRRLTKSFPGVLALNDVSFEVSAGTVHGLMGENGAGKSTLLKILCGAQLPTSGTLAIDGREQVFHSVPQALAAGVAVIQQELQLIPHMSVAENICLGHLPARGGIIDRRRLRELATAQLERLGESIDPDLPVGKLPIAQRQVVEIAKALSRGARIVAFDEPTSSLSAREAERLFQVIDELRAGGCTILYVSHRMEEIFRLCHACTVLRDGRHVRTYPDMTGVTPEVLVKDMVGREIASTFPHTECTPGTPALEVREITGPGISAPVSLEVAHGEIVGLFGLVGAGRSELMRLVFGAETPRSGEVRVDGQPVAIRSPVDAIAAGIAFCTEDRKKEGIVPMLSVEENCNLAARRQFAGRGGLINRGWERTNIARQIEALGIKTPAPAQPIKLLSGGNQQKVLLGRWLAGTTRVLLLDEPTRGVDVGAKSEIYKLIMKLAREGLGVVVVSSDLPEVLLLADRLLVMREGAISAAFVRGEATPEKILAHALPQEKRQPA
jgi:L-arabinose transport system ATP-binding protein